MGLFSKRLETRSVISDVIDREIELRQSGDAAWLIPAVYRAIQMTTDAISQLPLEVKDPDGKLLEPQPAPFRHPVHGLTRHRVMHQIMESMLWDGNAYVRLLDHDRAGTPTWVQVLDPEEVTVTPDRSRTRALYDWRGKRMRSVSEGRRGAQLLHIPLNLFPGRLTGVGPIEAARILTADIVTADGYARDWFKDGGVPSGTLESPNPMSEREIEILKATWDSARSGKADTGVLANGLTYKANRINPVDMAFLEQKVHSVGELARIFGIPGPLLGWAIEGGSSVVYQTTQTMAEWWTRFTLVPTFISRIEEELGTILPMEQIVTFDLGPFTRGDTKSRFEAYAIAIEAGILSAAEVRDLEGIHGPVPNQPATSPAPDSGGVG
jgi:HK97 family phage portal protein